MLTNGSREPSQCWWGRGDRGLCRSLAPLNLMLTDSNEDGLLARIENRRAQSSLHLSRPLIKASVRTHARALRDTDNTSLLCAIITNRSAAIYSVLSTSIWWKKGHRRINVFSVIVWARPAAQPMGGWVGEFGRGGGCPGIKINTHSSFCCRYLCKGYRQHD